MSDINSMTMEELYNEAYAVIDQGICFDEINHREGALAMYERGMQLIDRAGQLKNATKHPLYAKMAAARNHVIGRLHDLRQGAAGGDANNKLAAEQVVERPASPYADLTAAIDAFGESKLADELFVIPGGVQIFFIEGDDASVPTYPSELKIFRFRPDDASTNSTQVATNEQPPAFMQVGDWVYPLLPGRSPTLHTNWGAYVFPNPTADQPGEGEETEELYVGLILPSDLDRATVEQFENYLREYTVFQRQVSETPLSADESKRLASKIAELLVHTGKLIAWGVEKGAEKTAKTVSKKTSKYIDRTDATSQPVNVDRRLQTSVHYLRKGTKVAVKISGYLVDAVGQAAMEIGKSMARKVEKRLGGTGTAQGGFFHDAGEVIGGGVAGIATVWMTMEDAAKSLAKNIANDTCRVVTHKYGPEAGRVTNDALYAAGHGTTAAYNIESLGPKAIAKRTAKKAGLELLKDLTGGKKSTPAAIEGAPPGQGPSGK